MKNIQEKDYWEKWKKDNFFYKLWLTVQQRNKILYMSAIATQWHKTDKGTGYVGDQLVMTPNILSFSFFHHNLIGSPPELRRN